MHHIYSVCMHPNPSSGGMAFSDIAELQFAKGSEKLNDTPICNIKLFFLIVKNEMCGRRHGTPELPLVLICGSHLWTYHNISYYLPRHNWMKGLCFIQAMTPTSSREPFFAYNSKNNTRSPLQKAHCRSRQSLIAKPSDWLAPPK